jgi:ribonuclease T2
MFHVLVGWTARILIRIGRFSLFSRFAFFVRLVLVALLGIAAAGTASAQDRRQNTPGEFDFYVLSLSERGNEQRSQAQCGGRPFSFVVHGLWPQYEHGFPEYCDRNSYLDRDIMRSMLDLMPAPGLIFNEWKKHGTCAGLGPRPYFETIRKARAAVKIPPEFLNLTDPKTVTPSEVEEAFIKVNPGLNDTAISVTCNRTRLSEVRICMSKDLQFRACEELERRGCRRDQVTMPPVRGG